MTKREMADLLVASGYTSAHSSLMRKTKDELEGLCALVDETTQAHLYHTGEAYEPKQRTSVVALTLDAFASRRGVLICASYYRAVALGHATAAQGALVALSNI